MSVLLRFAVAGLLLSLVGCGGGGGGGSQGPSSPSGGGSNPCAAAGVTSAAAAPSKPHKLGRLGNDQRDVLDSLWRHRTRRDAVTTLSARLPDEDVGDIAVIRDDGSLVSRPNIFDLRGKGLRFQPNSAGGYDVVGTDATFRSSLGNRVTLGDDASTPMSVPFGFPFFGQTQTAAFINSDGNVTFGEGDAGSNERGLGRLLSGAPRAAPFFADLDPSVGGAVFVQASASAFTVTWCSVPGFGLPQRVTAQTTLLPDGSVEMKFDSSTSLSTGIVALSPGRGASFSALDLSAAGQLAGGSQAAGERFAGDSSLDDVALALRFYQTHSDDYDQLVIFGDDRIIEGGTAFAFELTVNNAVQGIGRQIFDSSRDYGSQGTLQSLVVMDRLSKYPDDPASRIPVLGEDSTLSIMGQETGHQWLAFMRFRDAGGRNSDALLGRDNSHWSFFFDSDASVMEGNDIEDLGGGQFRTVATVSRYCMLDLYAMGAVSASEVPPFFYVENPIGPGQTKESDPSTGVSFTGIRRDVTIDDVIAVMGSRQPNSRDAPRVHRQAFIYVLSAGRTTDASAEIAKLDRIREAWEAFFSQATGDRMRAETRLR
jgi:hypothetical protein